MRCLAVDCHGGLAAVAVTVQGAAPRGGEELGGRRCLQGVRWSMRRRGGDAVLGHHDALRRSAVRDSLGHLLQRGATHHHGRLPCPTKDDLCPAVHGRSRRSANGAVQSGAAPVGSGSRPREQGGAMPNATGSRRRPRRHGAVQVPGLGPERALHC